MSGSAFQEEINLRMGCLRLDGKIGPKTKKRFAALSDEDQTALLEKYPAVAQRHFGVRPKPEGDRRWISHNDIVPVAYKIMDQYDLPRGFADILLRLEPAKKRVDGVLHYDVKSRSPGRGTYRGLTQVGPSAWKDAKRFDKFDVLRGLSFSEIDDPVIALHAAAAYALMNITYLRNEVSDSVPITPVLLYVAHNQGPKGAKDVLDGELKVRGQQSKYAMDAINALRNA